MAVSHKIIRLSHETYRKLILEELGTAHFEVDQGQDGLQLSEADAAKERNPAPSTFRGFNSGGFGYSHQLPPQVVLHEKTLPRAVN